MSFDLQLLQEQLCKTLCGQVKIRATKQGFLQIVTPFAFPDGDRFQVYLKEEAAGEVKLTDFGHTFMHLSYENDLSKFREGSRGKLLDQVMATGGLKEDGGQLILNSSLDDLGANILRFGQSLTRIYDLTFLNRSRVASTFYDDLKEMLFDLIPEDKIREDYVVPEFSGGDSYPVDYRIQTAKSQIFMFGIANRDKARLVTIILEHWLREKIDFESLLIFEDQTVIPRPDLARLSNVGGPMVSSLDASDDFQRKILKMANN